MMDKQEYDELVERLDTRYALKADADKEIDEIKAALAANDTRYAIINTKLNLVLWLLGAIGAAVVAFLVKLALGG